MTAVDADRSTPSPRVAFTACGVEGGIQYSDAGQIPALLEGYKDGLRQRLLSLDKTEP